jgi:hypothetical protein
MRSATPELPVGFIEARAFHEISPLPGTPVQPPPKLCLGSGPFSADESL